MSVVVESPVDIGLVEPAMKKVRVETDPTWEELDADFDPTNPDKSKEEFRNYEDSARQAVVENHYRLMRKNQTVAFNKRMVEKYSKFGRSKMTVWEAFETLKSYVDSSDPDTNLPNLEHMLQTAESIRAAGHPDWFQLVGLIHDMGKMMFLWGTPEDGQEGTAYGPQWALGGDTWIVGCKIPESAVFSQFNKLNPDMVDSRYNTENGIHKEKCGMMNLDYAFGHDEYMYMMLKHNNCRIPEEGLAIIRFHSCYPWHTENCYTQFMTERDYELLQWVREFNKYDLYTKSDAKPDAEQLKPYYQSLIDKYMPGLLEW